MDAGLEKERVVIAEGKAGRVCFRERSADEYMLRVLSSEPSTTWLSVAATAVGEKEGVESSLRIEPSDWLNAVMPLCVATNMAFEFVATDRA